MSEAKPKPLEVGDRVYVNHGRLSHAMIETVARVLKTFVELSGGSKWTDKYGSGHYHQYPHVEWSTAHMRRATAEDVAKIRRARLIRKVCRSENDLANVPTKTLDHIAALLAAYPAKRGA